MESKRLFVFQHIITSVKVVKYHQEIKRCQEKCEGGRGWFIWVGAKETTEIVWLKALKSERTKIWVTWIIKELDFTVKKRTTDANS